jgi:hypothetical protein
VNPLPAARKPFFGDQRAMLLKKATHRTPAIPATGQTMQETDDSKRVSGAMEPATVI